MRSHHHVIEIDTRPGLHVHDLSEPLRQTVAESGIRQGLLAVTSRHTTTALTINEHEERLLEDIRRFFTDLVPADRGYLHNDLELRDCPPDEPRNAHSHVIATLLGSSESMPVVDGAPALGRWQSVMLVELDGPGRRTVNVQIVGE